MRRITSVRDAFILPNSWIKRSNYCSSLSMGATLNLGFGLVRQDFQKIRHVFQIRMLPISDTRCSRISSGLELTFHMSSNLTPQPIAPGVRIGHVHLKIADLDRALKFYCGVLGFELQQRFGSSAAFISAGGYHHHIGLNTWESAGGSPPPPNSTGLYHLAILYPTRAALADALRRLIAAGIELDGASDHGVSEALYLRDPDENGLELYWDRPNASWPRKPDGSLAMFTHRLDLEDLLRQREA